MNAATLDLAVEFAPVNETIRRRNERVAVANLDPWSCTGGEPIRRRLPPARRTSPT